MSRRVRKVVTHCLVDGLAQLNLAINAMAGYSRREPRRRRAPTLPSQMVPALTVIIGHFESNQTAFALRYVSVNHRFVNHRIVSTG